MLKSLTIPTCLALGLTIVASPTDAQVVREGLRRTGEVAVQGGRAVAQGTRNAIDRTGQATRNVIGGTTDAARAQVDRVQRNELRPGYEANLNGGVNASAQAGQSQIQADAGINSNQPLDGSAQAPLPEQPYDPALQGEYQSGYRGINDQGSIAEQGSGQASYDGRVYRLRHDRNGREFICVNGHAVYFDNQQGGQPQQHEAYKLNDDQMDYQQRQGQNDYRSNQHQGETQSNFAPPAPPAPIRSDLNSAAPANPSLNSDTDISAEQSTQLDESADVTANSNVGAAASSTTDANVDVPAASNADVNASTSNASVDAGLDADADSSDSSADASVDANVGTSNESSDQPANDSDTSNN